METPAPTLAIRFSTGDRQTFWLDLTGSHVGDVSSAFAPPYDPATWQAILPALEPDFAPAEADAATRAALQPLGKPDQLHKSVGTALANALLADDKVRTAFEVALNRAEMLGQSLLVEMRFGQGSDDLAALPWELLYHADRFLVADTSIALSRYPEEAIPPTRALADLPLRVLLVLSEPLGAPPILPERAREELLHGLRSLDEAGAVIVDLLRPPTFDTLVEAVTNGGYHVLVFYGHGAYDSPSGGQLLFEDEFGGPAPVQASELAAAVHNTGVRLVLLGACQSATVGAGVPARPGVWRGTAPALVRAGVPLAIGMQVSLPVAAALAFIRQFALSLAAGRPVIQAVADARKPLLPAAYGHAWFIPALYGRPSGDTRLFDPARPMPAETASLRSQMQTQRAEIARLEQAIGSVGVLGRPGEIAHLRAARTRFTQARAELARRTPGGYAPATSPLYGVPSNPVFVGRAQELQEAGQALKGEHPVVIWGTGGIGKTALAIEIAHRQGWRFPGGVLWLDCRGGPGFDTLLDRIGAFCGLADVDRIPPAEKPATVRWALAGLDARCLLVWDNAEDVWHDRAVRDFVDNRPGNCQVLITTRDDPERAMWPTVELHPLPGDAMTALFFQLAGSAGVKVATPADLDAIPRIVGWLQGHPLALALVVPLAKKRGLQRVWADLQQHPLKGIQAAFAVSYKRLSPIQRQLFTRLSVFSIPVTWEAVETIMPGKKGVDQALDVLVQRALVTFEGDRYAYHNLLRQFAHARLKDPRPVHRLAAEYLQAKITDQARGGTPDEALEEVDQWEKAEVRESFVRRASALVGSLDRLGYWGEIGERLERARQAVKDHLDSQPDLEAQLLDNLAAIAFKSARWDEAAGLLQEALAIHLAAADEQGLAQTYGNLGTVYADKGEWDRAIEFYQQSVEIKERLDDAHGLAQTYGNLGTVYGQKGEWDRAIAFFQQSVEIKERLGDVHGLAQTYNNLGVVYGQKGERDRAIAFYQQAVEIMDRLGDVHGLAGTYANLGLVYANKGEWDRAIAFYQQAVEIMDRLGDAHGLAQTYGNLGSVYANKGERDRAIAFYQQAAAIMERLGDVHGLAQTYMGLGLVHANRGEWEWAIAFYQQAVELMERLGDVHGLASTWTNVGLLYLQTERAEEAKPLLARAYLVFTQMGSPDADTAARALVEACGSVEAANRCLAQAVEEETSQAAASGKEDSRG